MNQRGLSDFLLVSCALIVSANAVAGEVFVRGYYRADGTYVKPHYRSEANETPWDNWSTVGNVNPHTGEEGTKNPVRNGLISPPRYLVEPREQHSDGLATPVQATPPVGATMYGSSWYCDDGYRTVRIGGKKVSCSKIYVPPNATAYQADWECNDGFRTIFAGRETVACERIPDNATAVGEDWQCNQGYRTVRIGGRKVSCERFVVPAHAVTYGSDWYCRDGYREAYTNGRKSHCIPK